MNVYYLLKKRTEMLSKEHVIIPVINQKLIMPNLKYPTIWKHFCLKKNYWFKQLNQNYLQNCWNNAKTKKKQHTKKPELKPITFAALKLIESVLKFLWLR